MSEPLWEVTIKIVCEDTLNLSAAFPDWKPGDPLPTLDDLKNDLGEDALYVLLSEWLLETKTKIHFTLQTEQPNPDADSGVLFGPNPPNKLPVTHNMTLLGTSC